MQEDTYGGDPNDPLSLNLYTYCSNNPIKYYDPSGHVIMTVNEEGNTVITYENSDNGKDVGVGYNPNDHIIVNIPEGVYVGNFGTSGSNVTFNIGGSVGKIGMPSNSSSHINGNNYGIVGSIELGMGSTVSLNNYGIIGSVSSGDYGTVAGNNYGIIGYVSLGYKSSSNIVNTEHAFFGGSYLKESLDSYTQDVVYGSKGTGKVDNGKAHVQGFFSRPSLSEYKDHVLNQLNNGLLEYKRSIGLVDDGGHPFITEEEAEYNEELAGTLVYGNVGMLGGAALGSAGKSITSIFSKIGSLFGKGAGSKIKSVDDILDGATAGRVTKGKTNQYVKPGDFNSASKEFDSLNPSNVKNINTSYGQGKTGTLPDGRTVTVRPGSTDGRPTLEIRNPNGRGIEIRYGE